MYDIITLRAWLQDFYRDTVEPIGYDKQLLIDEYGYPVSFASFDHNTGQAGTASFTINTNADFWLLGMYYTWTGAAALNASIQVTDAGSQKPFWSQAIPISLALGAAGSVNALAVSNSGALRQCMWPRLLPANSAMQVSLTGTASASVTGTVGIFFSGINVKNYGALAAVAG